jgi:hypothetical protein
MRVMNVCPNWRDIDQYQASIKKQKQSFRSSDLRDWPKGGTFSFLSQAFRGCSDLHSPAE